MNIPFKLIKDLEVKFTPDLIYFLIICTLYKNKLISKEKFLDQIETVRSGEFLKVKHSYHLVLGNINCWINKWSVYYQVLDNIYSNFSKYEKLNITLEDFIDCTKIYLNKRDKYCKQWVKDNYIEVILNSPEVYKYFIQVEDYDSYIIGSEHCCENYNDSRDSFNNSKYLNYLNSHRILIENGSFFKLLSD